MQVHRPDVDTILKGLSPEEMAEMLAMLEELDGRKRMDAARADFLTFIALLDRTYKFGTHLKRLGSLLMDVELGVKDRVAVSMAPRFGKSQMISIFYPAWYLGRNPDHKVIVASHTADLAVDMARKVRNLMQTAEYRAIFPDVSVAADAKAAGKWNTNKGGEYFACLRPHALVHTDKGLVPAGKITVGDRLQNASGFVQVRAIYNSEHAATYNVRGLPCSANHPIWTMTRGWVYAKDLKPTDLLCVESFWDRMKASILGVFHGTLEHPHVPPVVQHKKPLHQSAQREVGGLWRARDTAVRALAAVRSLLFGYGQPTVSRAHDRPDQCEWPVLAGELSMGYGRGTGEQPQKQCSDRWADYGSTRSGVGDHARDHTLSVGNGGRPIDGAEAAPEELRAYDHPENLKWYRVAAARVFSACGKRSEPREPRFGLKINLAGVGEAAQKLCGFFVGVRVVGVVPVAHHALTPFVNFLTDGDHTFYANNVLTHNCGVGGALAGRGGNLIVIDDPISEQAIKTGNTDVLDSTYEWFRSGLRTRLMPGGKLVVLHTRWHQRDVIGRLLKDAALNPEADQYEVFEFPAILHEGTDNEKSLWPEQWSIESLQRTKASMPLWQWNAQYQQNPTAATSAIIKREWIKWWPHQDPPETEFLIQSWDTALTTKERSDWSVCQTWGVWTDEETDSTNLILLNNAKGKWEFPDLKAEAHRQYAMWQPDSVIIEAKASGQPLIDEMRRSGIFVQDFSPGKGNDKIARLNAVADMFASGHVWFPETSWANEVVEEVLAFPAGDNDDMVDTLTLALRRARTGGLLRLSSDYEDNEYLPTRRRKGAYTV